MTEWTKEWPTKRGWYWLYGQTTWDMQLEYVPVQVWKNATDKPTYVAGPQFLYKAEGARGLWTRMIMPDPPTDFQIEEAIT